MGEGLRRAREAALATQKSTVSVSIKPENRAWIEQIVDDLDLRSFSHGIDRAIEAYRREVEASRAKAKKGARP